MKATRQLHELGQSLWLDNITRGILNDGTLLRLPRRDVGDGTDVQPHHLRSRSREG